MFQGYINRKFRADTLAVIDQANAIIEEFRADGFTVTLRQLYYQFVSRDLMPNKQSEYKRLGSIVNDGRLAGLMDWDAIEDRLRNLETISHWDSPGDILDSCVASYKEDLWADQEVRVEVWIEKDALTGVIEPICQELRLPYIACRGYMSQSEQWRAGQRIGERMEATGQRTVILHLGDHDPSGIDMTGDNTKRLNMFTEEHGDAFDLIRIALNMSQIETHRPPPNPAKETDSRFESYRARYGDESYELDALSPRVLAGEIRRHVQQHQDKDLWDAAVAQERRNHAIIADFAQNWDRNDE